MEPPLYFIDGEGNAIEQRDIPGNFYQESKYPVKFTHQKMGGTASMAFLRQYYDAFLSYLELYEFNCAAETNLGFKVDKPIFLLCFITEGEAVIDGQLVISLKTQECNGILLSKGIYRLLLTRGCHTLLFLAVNISWLRSLDHVTHLFRPYFEQFLMDEHKLLPLPTRRIDGSLSIKLRKLMLIQVRNEATISATVLLTVAGIIAEYHDLLTREATSEQTLAYRVLEFIGRNYRDPDLSSKMIASALYTTSDTLTKHFRKEFKMTLHLYITHLRMRLAADILTGIQYPPHDLYRLAGYRDPHTFRVRFKTYHGFPPGKYPDIRK